MAEKARKKISSESSASESEAVMPTIKLSPPSDYSVIPSSRLTLLCGMGEVDGGHVLAPYVQLQIYRAENPEAGEHEIILQSAFQTSLSYENLAFVIMDLARDFRVLTGQLSRLSSGALHYEPTRLAYAASVLGDALEAIEAAGTQLTEMAANASDRKNPPNDPSESVGLEGVKRRASGSRKTLKAPRRS